MRERAPQLSARIKVITVKKQKKSGVDEKEAQQMRQSQLYCCEDGQRIFEPPN